MKNIILLCTKQITNKKKQAMKKTILIILAALAAAFAFVSCEKEQEDPKEELKQIRYTIVGYTFVVEPYNIVIYEYDEYGKILARRTIYNLREGETKTYLSAPGLDNMAIYCTNEAQTKFYKQLLEKWEIGNDIAVCCYYIEISREEYFSYTTNN